MAADTSGQPAAQGGQADHRAKSYRLPPGLTVGAWETQFGKRRGPLSSGGTWLRQVRGDGFCLDFSKVEFADFAALARALLLLDAAVRDKIEAHVILPTASLSRGEQEHLERLAERRHPAHDAVLRRTARQARQRGAARAFMEHVGFPDALCAPHWPPGAVRMSDAGVVIEGQPPVEPADSPFGAMENELPPYRLRRIFPFRWLRPLSGDQLRESEFFLTTVTGLRDLGLSKLDARSLSHAVLTELVENVAEHAGLDGHEPPRALVAAVLLDPITYRSRGAFMPRRLAELADAIAAADSRVMRLIVGDSGIGLVNRLEPVLVKRKGGSRSRADHAQSRSEDTILYAFDRWSTSRDMSTDARRGTRGLWRVARLVRSYRGSVVIRTADAIAGLLFAESTSGTEITDGPVGIAPGTLLEVSVLPESRAPEKLPASWDDVTEVVADGDIDLVNCAFDPKHGLGDADSQRLVEAARAAAHSRRVSAVVAAIPIRDTRLHLSDAATQTALRRVLDTAGLIANPTAVVVVFPNADPRILDLSVTGIHVDEEQSLATPEWNAPRSPVLVLGSFGRPLWCGGSEPFRNMLNTLTNRCGALSIRDARQLWVNAGGDPPAFPRTIRDQQHLLLYANNELRLRLSVGRILKKLRNTAGKQLENAIDNNGPSIERGLFRTPMLRLTSKWIDVERLLTDTVSIDLAAFVLAREVDEQIRQLPVSSRSIVVAQAATAPDRLASQLSECLSLGGRYYAMPGELDLDGLPRSEQVPRGSRVVLCADTILTENTVRRAAASIVGSNAELVAITCVVDARRERAPIVMFNKTIPVVTLSEVNLDPGDEEPAGPIVDIDPILRRPLHTHSPAEPLYPIIEDDLLDWCSGDRGTLRLGHIESPRKVHFSAFLQLDRMLNDDAIAGRVTTAIERTIETALGAWGLSITDPAKRRLQLWHPGPEEDYAGRLATMVKTRLASSGYHVGPVESIPRAVAGDRWMFPTGFDWNIDCDSVVIIDWGALSANTVQQMIRLAANTGAPSICAVILLNQMINQEAESLTIQRAVVAQHRTGCTAVPIPISIRFITTSSIVGLPAHDCAICATRGLYQNLAESAPRRLRKHIAQISERIRPRSRQEVFRDTAIDLFNEPVKGQDVADYLRWRGLLQRSLRITSVRQEVMDRLVVLTEPDSEPGWSRPGLIRLLAAEQQWLKLPPLRFAEAREHLANAATASLDQTPTTFPWLQTQGLMVLSVCNPERFAQSLPDLVARAIDEPLLIDQMFLDCFRLLRRSPRDLPVDLSRLRFSLLRCRDLLEGCVDLTPTADDHLHVVRSLITLADHLVRPRPVDPQTAWDLLREDLMRLVLRHRLDSTLLRVRDYVEELGFVEPAAMHDIDPRGDWDKCTTQLAERALVNLPALYDILAGEYVADTFGKHDQRRLLRLAEPNAIVALQEVGDMLHRLIRRPWLPDDPNWENSRSELLRRINWWYTIFVATHLPDGDQPALLVDFIRSVPTDLKKTVYDAFTAHRGAVEFGPGHEQLTARTFCPRPLLGEAIAHLVENAQRHRVANADLRFRVDYAIQPDGFVHVLLRNSGSRARGRHGKGLRSYDEKLAPFGGRLTGSPISENEWTFLADIKLPTWRGA